MDIKETMDNISDFIGVKSVRYGKYPKRGYDYKQPTIFVKMRDHSRIEIIENDAFKHKGYNSTSLKYDVSVTSPFYWHAFASFLDAYLGSPFAKDIRNYQISRDLHGARKFNNKLDHLDVE